MERPECDGQRERPDEETIMSSLHGEETVIPDACTHQLFEEQVNRTPDAAAVTCGDLSLSYRELNSKANQLANHLRGLGVGPEALIGICLPRTPELVVSLLAVWKAGGAYVPMDAAYPQERLAFMATDSDALVLITNEHLRQRFPSLAGRLLPVDSAWPEIEQQPASNPGLPARPGNLAYVMYTSGSSGKPKGVMIVHRGLVNYIVWAANAYGMKSGMSSPVHSSISFDLTVTSLYPALICGGTAELLPEHVGAQQLLELLRRDRLPRLVKITPAHLELLNRQLAPEDVADTARTFVIGGENLPAESLALWREHAPGTRLINEYGPTETAVGCCVHEIGSGDASAGSVPIGGPIANTQLHVLDGNLRPVPPGKIGELYIGGAGVARGYLNLPDLTDRSFLPDTFSGESGARMYKTGDLARCRADGVLEYMGRMDNQVKVRGYRIELGEIEQALAAHPDVQACVVLAREDTPSMKQLVAYVTARRGRSPEAAALRDFLGACLPEYMVPAKFVFVDVFPLTPNGKVDRKALPAPVHQFVASPGNVASEPRTDTERQVSAIWRELLGIGEIGLDDDVFDLGADSLMAVMAITGLQEAFKVDVRLKNLFEAPTIAGQAKVIDQLGWIGQLHAGEAGEREEIEL